jgi:heme oxygenase
MITDQLKTATLPAHQQLEKLLVYRIKSIHSKEQYLGLLRLFYGFCLPLEEIMMDLLPQNILPDLAERRKAGALLHDIQGMHMGGDVNIPLCGQMPALTNTGEALGALYVMEGSTLGGAIIVKMVQDRVPALVDESLRFFYGYGPETAAKWDLFKETLNVFAATEQDQQAVIYGANETFQAFHAWIQQHEITPTNE